MTNSVLNRMNAVVEQYIDDEDIDQNEAVTTSGGRKLPEGKALARLIRYVELGPQLSKAYPDKPPVNRFYLEFAVWGKGKDKTKAETFHEVVNGKMVPGLIRTQQINVQKDLNAKSGAYKLFRRMNPDKAARHFAQLLNHTFILPIVHTTTGEGDAKKEYVNIDLENISLAVNPVTDEPFDVPAIDDEAMFKLFLWNRPTKEDWDALYIEGKRDDGKSKNWIQDTLLSSPDFPGSPLDTLLHGAGPDSAVSYLPDLPDEPRAAAASQPDLPVDPVPDETVPDDIPDFNLPAL